MQPPTAIKRRLNELGLRSRLRARPRLQGRILAPAGLRRRLPSAPGLYFPFYHDVLPEYGADLRRHLNTLRRIGPMVSWDESLRILAGERPLTGPVFCLSFDDAHLSWRDVAAPVLLEMRVPAMFFLTSGLVGQPGNLTWQDCRDLVAAGFAFGSHTVTHHRLADQDDETAAREIVDSKREIEDQLGVEVRDFAAPYGNPAVDFLDRDVEVAREAGYRSFATTLRPAMRPGDSPMFIHRQGLHPAWPILAMRTRVHD
ncbi:polysaccharide deacetylase family protein [Actinoplanes aureus]|uniref:Polysaccharide deacetylase family protein n=1 Tax=Actinoplanes aureus TaxID=2792083 RepID=A0A931C769_9ACTN|nr:polysaccharide deacetylase family protein [Actinoplanes aureus]MBG0562637.1 polysaccharide deacetylase family protein [Actinoplanes aureus]